MSTYKFGICRCRIAGPRRGALGRETVGAGQAWGPRSRRQHHRESELLAEIVELVLAALRSERRGRHQ
ncbi:hypothetical protein Q3G72_028140 [Acer saccharum]|nr:hypothetical protein Q3G72_028140 [Acer saccharum]